MLTSLYHTLRITAPDVVPNLDQNMREIRPLSFELFTDFPVLERTS